MGDLPKENEQQLRELESFLAKSGVSALLPFHDLLQEISKSLKILVEKEAPEVKTSEVQKMEIEGAEVVTIKGEPGEAGHTPTEEELVALIKPLIPEIKDGKTPTKEELLALIRPLTPKVKDGETPSDERLLALIEPLIPVVKDGEPGKDGSPDTPDQVLEKVNKAEGLIKRERVEGLDEEIARVERKIPTLPKMGMRKIPIIKSVRLTSQVDGNTRAFTLPKDTVGVLGLWGTEFPVTFDTADWSLAGNTLTLDSGITTPASGQTLIAIVETLFYG